MSVKELWETRLQGVGDTEKRQRRGMLVGESGVIEGGEVWTSGRDDVGRGKLNGVGLVGTDEVDLGASWR